MKPISIHDCIQMPEPYTSIMLWEEGDQKQWWFGYYDCANDLWVYYFGHEEKSDRNITHWRPLPESPKKEEI